MSKHTPGPWWAEKDMGHSPCEGAEGHGLPDWVVGCHGPHEVAHVARRYHNGRLPEVEAANARLIAAAPELLAALELVARNLYVNDYGEFALYSRFDDTPIAAAIAKARGE